MPATLPTEADVFAPMETCNSWGRWGTEGELGPLKLTTPEKCLTVFPLLRAGTSVTCFRPVVTGMTADRTFQVMRFMIGGGYACTL